MMAPNSCMPTILVLWTVLFGAVIPVSSQFGLLTSLQSTLPPTLLSTVGGRCPMIEHLQLVKGKFDSIRWPDTNAGETATMACPFGPEGGKATRKCISNRNWEKPDLSQCQTINLKSVVVTKDNVKESAKELKDIFKKNSPKEKSKNDVIATVNRLEKIVAITERLDETAEDIVETVNAIMEVNGTILAETGNATTRAVQVLEKLSESITLNAKKKELNSTNLLLQIIDITKSSYKGVSFRVHVKASSPDNHKSESSVTLPASILNNATKNTVRVGFVYFANNKLFQEEGEKKNAAASQVVLSSSVYGVETINLPDSVVLKFPRADKNKVTNQSCVFWNETDRQWANAGCSLCPEQNSSESVECCCNHLTSFAVLFSPEKGKPSSDIHQQILSIISIVGCIISLICVILTFLTYLIFKHLRKTNQQLILMNLCIAIALLLIVFVSGINSTDNRLGCQIVAVLLHYLTLVTVLWMGVEAYNLYLQIVKVMAIYQRRFMLKAALVGWGAPLVIVFATVIAATVEYDKSKDVYKTFKYGSDFACVLDDNLYKIIAWFAPILGILLFNLITFVLVIYKLNSTGAMITVDSKSQQRRRCWTALAIMCLLGLTWLFGALAISGARIAFEYLFCIFNSLQGFFIFFFHCIRIREVRSQWSFFVSGLGFSHRESEYSHQKSKGFDESHHSSEAFVRVRSWIDKDGDSQPAKESPIMNHSPRRDSAQDQVELNDSSHANNNSYMT